MALTQIVSFIGLVLCEVIILNRNFWLECMVSWSLFFWIRLGLIISSVLFCQKVRQVPWEPLSLSLSLTCGYLVPSVGKAGLRTNFVVFIIITWCYDLSRDMVPQSKRHFTPHQCLYPLDEQSYSITCVLRLRKSMAHFLISLDH